MDFLVSVIVPVYRVEQYLKRCFDSLINQSYQNIEILLIDDGSPDNSGAICDELAQKDDRVRVYHKANGGLSDARNYGVERATGQYITFIDSDDYVSPDYIKILAETAASNNADIAACCYYRTESDKFEVKENRKLPSLQVLSGIEAVNSLFDGGENYSALVIACAKLIKADIVKKYPFPVGKKHEDEATTAKFIYGAKTVAIINKCLYAYYQNGESITHTKGSKKNEDAIWALKHRAEFFENSGEKDLAKRAYSNLFSYLAHDSLFNNRRCDNDIKALLKGKRLTFRFSVYRVIYGLSPRLYKIIRRF